VKRFSPQGKVFEISSWPEQPLFVEAHADLIRQEAARFADADESTVHLLFSAHSIPEKLVSELNDPYPTHVDQTAKAIVKKTEWKGPWSIAWQSRLGPVKWLEPSTVNELKRLGAGRTEKSFGCSYRFCDRSH